MLHPEFILKAKGQASKISLQNIALKFWNLLVNPKEQGFYPTSIQTVRVELTGNSTVFV